MFTAGFLPGILMGIALMLVCYIVSKKKGYKGNDKRKNLRDMFTTFKEAFWAILSPVIILGGIYSGKFTPTEATVVSVVYSFIVGVFVYRELDMKGAYNSVKDAIVVNGATTFMIGLSTAFAKTFNNGTDSFKIAAFITNLSGNGIIILLLINIFY